MNISVAPEVVFHLGNLPITNTKTTAVLITVLLLALGWYVKKTFSLVPTRLQTLLEIVLGFVLFQVETAFNSRKRARQLSPIILSLLLMIFISNQLLVFPILGQIILGDVSVFRTLTSDISEAIALALLVLLIAHGIAFSISPLRHIGNFLKFGQLLKVRSWGDLGNTVMDIFLGLMDIISEFAKLFSLSFRLFGNVFAGELVILVITSLSFATKFFVPIPFMVLSIFSGIVQALVFTMLAIQFMAGTINAVGDSDTEVADEEKLGKPEMNLTTNL